MILQHTEAWRERAEEIFFKHEGHEAGTKDTKDFDKSNSL